MKRILFGSAAAICTVIGLSSFTYSITVYYWFFTDDAHQVAIPGAGREFDNSQVISFIATSSGFIVDPIGACSGGSHWCAAAFTANQVIATIAGGFMLYTTDFTSQLNVGNINQRNP